MLPNTTEIDLHGGLQFNHPQKTILPTEDVAQVPLEQEEQNDSDSYWMWDSNVPQSQQAIESYWYWDSSEQGEGMTVMKKVEREEKRSEAIARVEERVAHYKRNRLFSGKGIEELLMKASRKRFQELKELEAARPDASYWDM